MNAILVQADALGQTLYYGKGAGGEPTASSVVADVIDVARLHTADPEHRVKDRFVRIGRVREKIHCTTIGWVMRTILRQ